MKYRRSRYTERHAFDQNRKRNKVGRLIDSRNGTSYKGRKNGGKTGGTAIPVRCGINFSLIYTSSTLAGLLLLSPPSLSLSPSLRGLAREQRSEISIREPAPYLIYCKLAVPSLNYGRAKFRHCFQPIAVSSSIWTRIMSAVTRIPFNCRLRGVSAESAILLRENSILLTRKNLLLGILWTDTLVVYFLASSSRTVLSFLTNRTLYRLSIV